MTIHRLPAAIRNNHAGIERGHTVTGACAWVRIEGWACLVDEAGLIHQVGGHECDRHLGPIVTMSAERAETWGDNF